MANSLPYSIFEIKEIRVANMTNYDELKDKIQEIEDKSETFENSIEAIEELCFTSGLKSDKKHRATSLLSWLCSEATETPKKQKVAGNKYRLLKHMALLYKNNKSYNTLTSQPVLRDMENARLLEFAFAPILTSEQRNMGLLDLFESMECED